MKPRLSIVVPCYNSAKTLREAVDSCYVQGIPESEFEVILVDDGSTDGTAALIKALCSERSNVRASSHEKNKGGGAARNTGIRMASGELIYCLDSDNIFAPESVKGLIATIDRNGVDAAAFETRRFFSGKSLNRFSVHRNGILDRDITLSDLFSKESVLLDNFLFTKKSFERTAGFPEHHGFDTQSFEMRYLAAGNRVRISPNSVFYHRQAHRDASYFEREYAAGNFSLNYYLCVEDIFDRLSSKARTAVMEFDIFKRSSLHDNLMVMMKDLHAQGVLFQEDQESSGAHQAFGLGVALIRTGDFDRALSSFASSVQLGAQGTIVYYNILRCSLGISGIRRNELEKKTMKTLLEMRTEPRRLYRFYHRIPLINWLISRIRT